MSFDPGSACGREHQSPGLIGELRVMSYGGCGVSACAGVDIADRIEVRAVGVHADAVATQQRERELQLELVPQLLESQRGGNLSVRPQDPYHLAVHGHAGGVAGAHVGQERADDRTEPVAVGLAIDEERRQGRFGVEDPAYVALEGDATLMQIRLDPSSVQPGGHYD